MRNLLSAGIVKRDGSPGRNFAKAAQHRASVTGIYQLTPRRTDTCTYLPRPAIDYAADQRRGANAGLDAATLPKGPFQITRHDTYVDHVREPSSRFFQMWQQVDGGRNDLYVWAAETSGDGTLDADGPVSLKWPGGAAMGFYNMAAGDAAYLRQLADDYAMSDNHHQSVMGGAGANFQALVTGHAIAYMRQGKPAVPPAGRAGRRGRSVTKGYCDSCDPLVYSSTVMGGPMKARLQDLAALFRDLKHADAMPAVAFVTPPRAEAGASSAATMARLESFLRRLIDAVQAEPALWQETAIFITSADSGGYYDSGSIQTIDAFGDGPRMPLLVVSPFAREGRIDHSYTDHASS